MEALRQSFAQLTPEAWSAMGTWITALVAVVAAAVAYRQVREARRLREAQAQPFVVVTLEPAAAMSNLINLRVENIGHTLATEVSFSFDPPLHSKLAEKDPHYSLTEGRMFREGIPFMPPGFAVERIYDDAMLWDEEDDSWPPAYEVRVNFSDHAGRRQEPLTYKVDLRPLKDGAFIEVRTLHDVGEALRDIRTELKQWTEGAGRGVKVWARDGDDRDSRLRAMRQEQLERVREKSQSAPAEADAPTTRGNRDARASVASLYARFFARS
jgi:hypothetical protein